MPRLFLPRFSLSVHTHAHSSINLRLSCVRALHAPSYSIAKQVFAMFFMLAFLFPASRLIRALVVEKETKVRHRVQPCVAEGCMCVCVCSCLFSSSNPLRVRRCESVCLCVRCVCTCVPVYTMCVRWVYAYVPLCACVCLCVPLYELPRSGRAWR